MLNRSLFRMLRACRVCWSTSLVDYMACNMKRLLPGEHSAFFSVNFVLFFGWKRTQTHFERNTQVNSSPRHRTRVSPEINRNHKPILVFSFRSWTVDVSIYCDRECESEKHSSVLCRYIVCTGCGWRWGLTPADDINGYKKKVLL